MIYIEFFTSVFALILMSFAFIHRVSEDQKLAAIAENTDESPEVRLDARTQLAISHADGGFFDCVRSDVLASLPLVTQIDFQATNVDTTIEKFELLERFIVDLQFEEAALCVYEQLRQQTKVKLGTKHKVTRHVRDQLQTMRTRVKKSTSAPRTFKHAAMGTNPVDWWHEFLFGS